MDEANRSWVQRPGTDMTREQERAADAIRWAADGRPVSPDASPDAHALDMDMTGRLVFAGTMVTFLGVATARVPLPAAVAVMALTVLSGGIALVVVPWRKMRTRRARFALVQSLLADEVIAPRPPASTWNAVRTARRLAGELASGLRPDVLARVDELAWASAVVHRDGLRLHELAVTGDFSEADSAALCAGLRENRAAAAAVSGALEAVTAEVRDVLRAEREAEARACRELAASSSARAADAVAAATDSAVPVLLQSYRQALEDLPPVGP